MEAHGQEKEITKPYKLTYEDIQKLTNWAKESGHIISHHNHPKTKANWRKR